MSFDSFHLLDADVWKELEDKTILSNGYVYAGRKLTGKFEVKVYVKKIEETKDNVI